MGISLLVTYQKLRKPCFGLNLFLIVCSDTSMSSRQGWVLADQQFSCVLWQSCSSSLCSSSLTCMACKQVEDFYFSSAAGRARIVLGNRRWGENGYVSSGRQQGRPVQRAPTKVSLVPCCPCIPVLCHTKPCSVSDENLQTHWMVSDGWPLHNSLPVDLRVGQSNGCIGGVILIVYNGTTCGGEARLCHAFWGDWQPCRCLLQASN